MHPSLRISHWSQVHLHAIATAAGYSLTVPGVDDDSIDFCLSGRLGTDHPCPPRVELQLKGTTTAQVKDDHIAYRLKKKNYEDLRITNVLVPRILVVVLVPKTDAEWLRHSEEELIVRRCGYWASLAGYPDWTARGDQVSVKLPRSNILSIDGLRSIMMRAASREPL